MSIYQFLIAVRQQGVQLTSSEGETTSHLMGMFYRTIRMVENGIKPFYVFDGKPPDMKGGELAKRKERRDETEKALKVGIDCTFCSYPTAQYNEEIFCFNLLSVETEVLIFVLHNHSVVFS
jgi:5'-3' exonuclease